MLLIAGESNEPVLELWDTTAQRSFTKNDGWKRLHDLASTLRPIETAEGKRHEVYPGDDARVMRVVTKIVRGLSYHHGVMSPVSEAQVRADILKYALPQEWLDLMESHHREQDIINYKFLVFDGTELKDDLHSVWLLTFFERTEFIAAVTTTEATRQDDKEQSSKS